MDLADRRPIWTPPAWVSEEIRAILPDDWELRVLQSAASGEGDGGMTSPEALAAVRGAEVYLGYGISPELFAAATAPPEGRLRWVHSGSAGVRGALFPAMRRSDVLLTNSAGIHAEPISETVLAMILYFARGLDFAVRAQAAARWEKAPYEAADSPVREVAGMNVGVVGFGGIGREVAKKCGALGMRVLATRRSAAPSPPGVEVRAGEDALAWLLAESDVVVLCLPETDETRGVIGREELERMRPGAVLVNVGRGSAVDEGALVDALTNDRLRGAALDVFEREPLPGDSPLWVLPNVLITPHVSGTTSRFWRREADLIGENLRRYLTGRPLLNEVDKEAGY
jgi:phosphoglycerate dehydrogenase-like enzyme